MATISSELDRIKQAKSDLRAVIESKGVPVDPMATIDKYPSFVEVIQTGGSPVLQNKTVTTNGTVTADSGYDGLGTVTVNVSPNLSTLNATQNGTYTPTSPVQGYSSVVVNVSTPSEPFYVEDLSGVTNRLTITKQDAAAPSIEVFYSSDGTTWTSMGTTSTTPIGVEVPAGGKLYLKALTTAWSDTDYHSNTINVSRGHNVGGYIMSLIAGDDYKNASLSSIFTFFSLFGGNKTLVSAKDLILPKNTTERCYQDMFNGCSALTVAPELPATILSENCYVGMFTSCTSLMQSPVLPATTLAGSSYLSLFRGCSALNVVISYAQDISAGGALEHWLDGVSQTGDFFNLGGATYTSGADGIPSGWTEHNSI